MGKTILVVDDSATIRKFVSASLNIKGYRVITAADGIEALEKMPSEKIDLIIADLNMPDMDGFELIRTMKESSEYREIPIIVLSSITDLKDKNQALQMGANVFLEKPFSAEVIQKEVSKLIG